MRCRYKIRHPGIPKEGNLILAQKTDTLCTQQKITSTQDRGEDQEKGEDRGRGLSLLFDTPERGIARGQMAAIYSFDGVCFGGGEIYC